MEQDRQNMNQVMKELQGLLGYDYVFDDEKQNRRFHLQICKKKTKKLLKKKKEREHNYNIFKFEQRSRVRKKKNRIFFIV